MQGLTVGARAFKRGAGRCCRLLEISDAGLGFRLKGLGLRALLVGLREGVRTDVKGVHITIFRDFKRPGGLFSRCSRNFDFKGPGRSQNSWQKGGGWFKV